jgi:hypothetical protein
MFWWVPGAIRVRLVDRLLSPPIQKRSPRRSSSFRLPTVLQQRKALALTASRPLMFSQMLPSRSSHSGYRRGLRLFICRFAASHLPVCSSWCRFAVPLCPGVLQQGGPAPAAYMPSLVWPQAERPGLMGWSAACKIKADVGAARLLDCSIARLLDCSNAQVESRSSRGSKRQRPVWPRAPGSRPPAPPLQRPLKL